LTLINISLASYIVEKLRNNIQDYNTNRSSQFGNWIFGDKPKIVKLLSNSGNFPRISVESITNNTIEDIGMECSDQIESQSLKINVWTARDLLCDIKSTVAEEIFYTTAAGDIYPLANLPTSIISLVTGTLGGVPSYTFVKGTDYQLIDNDSDGFFDSIEWIGTNKPDNSTIFYVNYQRKASADELCRFIAQEINEYLRVNWRGWAERIVWGYRRNAGGIR
jgi:hypothetical protein